MNDKPAVEKDATTVDKPLPLYRQPGMDKPRKTDRRRHRSLDFPNLNGTDNPLRVK